MDISMELSDEYLGEICYDDNEAHGFHWLDYVVFISTLLLSLGVGVYHGCVGEKTTKDYLMGNRQLKPLPVALSIFMSVISGILVLGLSAEMYMYGTQMWMDAFARSIFYAISAWIFVPMMYKLKITSVYEYHSLRFGSSVLHMTCVVLQIVSILMYMGLAMYAPSTALEAVTGFPIWASIVCIGIVAVFYTTIGGIKAVVWTDFLQGIILFGGLFIVLIVGCVKVGGLENVWEISKANDRIMFFNMNPDPTERMTFWAVFFGSGFVGLANSASEQTQVQRYCALPSVKDATLAVLLQIPLLIVVYSLVCLCGLVAFAYYDMLGCDPYRSGLISNTNQILPYFVVDAIGYPGLTGLFVAVLFSGALSSVSSSMSSLAAITWKDIFEKHAKGMTEAKKTLITKIASFVYGVIGVCIGFLMKNLRGHVMQLSNSVLGGLYGPLSAVIVAGSLFPWIQWKGMTFGLLSGVFMTTWINIGQYIYYPHRTYLNTTVENCSFGVNETELEIPNDPTDVFWLYDVSYMYIMLIGFISTILGALMASFITGYQDPKDVHPATLVDVGSRIFCCFGPTCQDKCRCGVVRDDEEEEEEQEEDIEKEKEKGTEKQNGYSQNGGLDYTDDKLKKENITNRKYKSQTGHNLAYQTDEESTHL